MADVPPLDPTPPAPPPPAEPLETLPAMQLRSAASVRASLDTWEEFIRAARKRVAAQLPTLRETVRTSTVLVELLGAEAPPEMRVALAEMRENLRRAVEIAGPEA